LLFMGKTDMYAQSYQSITLPDSLDVIDIVTDTDGIVYILERYGLYTIRSGRLQKLTDFQMAVDRLDAFEDLQDSLIVRNARHGFTEVHLPDLAMIHKLPSNQGMLVRNNEMYFLLDRNIYLFNESWTGFESKDSLDDWYGYSIDGLSCFFNDSIMMCYHINRGLDTIQGYQGFDEITWAGTAGDTLWIASCSQLIAYKKTADTLHTVVKLETPGKNCVFDVVIHDNNIYVMDDRKIYHSDARSNQFKQLPLTTESQEEWKAIAPGNHGDVWIASNQRIINIGSQNIDISTISGIDADNSFYYTIRGNNYISNGSVVFQQQQAMGIWEVDRTKSAPSKVFTPNDGHPVLLFDQRLMRIHKSNALILDFLPLPENEVFLDVELFDSRLYLAGAKGVYSYIDDELKKIEDFETGDAAFQILESQLALHTDHKIYLYSDDRFISAANLEDSSTSSRMVSENVYLQLKASQLTGMDITTGEEWALTPAGQEVLDFRIHENRLLVLVNDKLLMYEIAKLQAENPVPLHNIPIQKLEDRAKIVDTNGQSVIILTRNKLLSAAVPEHGTSQEPVVKLVYNTSNNTITALHSEYWQERPSYNFLFTGSEGEESIWTRNAVFPLEEKSKKYEQVVVKIKDGLGINSIRSNVINLPFKKPIPLRYYLILLILIFATALSGFRLIKA